MQKDDKKVVIVETLAHFGKLPTTRLSAITGINYVYIKKVLKELLEEKVVKCSKAGDLATYWELEDADK